MPDEIPAPIELAREEQPKPSFWQKNKIAVIAIVVGVVVVALAVGLVSLAMAYPSQTAVVRDLMIIAMAVVSFLTGLFLLALVYQIAMLTQLLRDEIKPLLESANETMNVLRGTTAFMSDNLVEPTIKASSTVAGARRILKVLMDWRPGAGSKS